MQNLRILAAAGLTLLWSAPVSPAQKTYLPTATPAMQTGGEVAAQAAANVWLAILDDGQYERSWDAAATIVHRAVTKEQWVKIIKDHRPKLGKVLSRTSKSSRFTPTMPNAPAGQYVALEFSTNFEHKAGATEVLTTALDTDGQWKVSGYFVK